MKDIPSVIFPKPKIKFITYNVWFEDYDFEERADELSKILESSSPDYICLQEVTKRFVEIVTAKSFVMKDYYVSLVKICSYFHCNFVVKTILRIHSHDFGKIPFWIIQYSIPY